MRNFIGIIAIFIFSLGFLALQPALAQTNPYFPLEAGLHCTFTSDMASPPEFFVTVTGTELFYGHTVWAVQNNFLGSADYRLDFYSIGPDGDLFFHGVRTIDPGGDMYESVIDPPYCLLDLPVSPGKTWSSAYSWTNYINGILNDSLDGYLFSGEIIATDSDVTAPAGNFTAVEVSGDIAHDSGIIPAVHSDAWFVQDVGPVRRESFTMGNPEVFMLLMYSVPVALEGQSWGSVKALFR